MLIRSGLGLSFGVVFSVLLFKRRVWPATVGLGFGAGRAWEECDNVSYPAAEAHRTLTRATVVQARCRTLKRRSPCRQAIERRCRSRVSFILMYAWYANSTLYNRARYRSVWTIDRCTFHNLNLAPAPMVTTPRITDLIGLPCDCLLYNRFYTFQPCDSHAPHGPAQLAPDPNANPR